MENVNCPGWPLYINDRHIYVRAMQISSMTMNVDGSWLAGFQGGYPAQYLTQSFIKVTSAQVGDYLIISPYGELVWMKQEDFESTYKKVGQAIPPITEIPTASADTLGGVKIGSGLDIQTDGTLSVKKAAAMDDSGYPVISSLADVQSALMFMAMENNQLRENLRNAGLMEITLPGKGDSSEVNDGSTKG